MSKQDNPLATEHNPYATGKDYSKIPQRLHKYLSFDKAKKIVHDSMTMDTLFSGTWPEQWSNPEGPEFHDQMDRCIDGKRHDWLSWACFHGTGRCPFRGTTVFQMFVVAMTILAGIMIGYTIIRPEKSL